MTRLEQIRDAWHRYHPTLKSTLLSLTGLASLFAVLSVSDCSFMIAARYSYDTARVGLFSQAMYDLTSNNSNNNNDGGAGAAQSTHKLGCLQYADRDQFDGMFRAGRAFGVMTPFLTLLAFLCMGYALVWCPKRTPCIWMASKCLMIAGTVSQMLVFLALGSSFMCSQKECKLTGVGVLATVNILLLVGVSVSLFLEPAPRKPWLTWWDNGEDNESQVYLQRVDPQVVHYIREKQQQRQVSDADVESSHQDSRGDSSIVQHVSTIDQKYKVQPLEEPAPFDTYDHEAGQQVTDDVGITGSLSTSHHDHIATDVDGSSRDSTTVFGVQHLTTFRFILLSLFLFAWAVSIAGVSRCSFLMIGPTGEDISRFTGMGLFSRAVYYDGQVLGCLDYSSQSKSEFDPVFVASRIFGAVTAFLMTIILVLVLIQVFVNRYRVELWFLVRLLLPCATLCQLFVFFIYKTELCNSSSQVECLPGQLGIWVIINVILMTVLCFLAFIMPPPPHPLFAVVKHHQHPQLQSQDQAPSHAKSQTSSILPLFTHMRTKRSSSSRRASSSIGTSVLSEEAAEHGFSLERIVRIDPMKKSRQSRLGSAQRPIQVPPEDAFCHNSSASIASASSSLDAGPASYITVTLEYTETQKRIVKTVTHPDGSKTITTTIEELGTSSEGSSDPLGNGTESSVLIIPSPEDSASECDDGGEDHAHRKRPVASDLDYEDEEEKLIANMIRDPPGTTATGRFAPRRGVPDHMKTHPSPDDSEHSVKEIIVVTETTADDSEKSDSCAGTDMDGDGSLTVETAVEDKEYYSDTA